MNLTDLRNHFQGTIILPDDPSYESARSVMMRRGTPALIAQVASATDVAHALRYATENNLIISVRSGGHSGAGHSTNDGGIIIDVSLLNDVTLSDPATGRVRIGAGARWGDVAKELHRYGLALSSGDTKSVGVSGLTLGGGIGWMVRKYGLAIDSLVSVDIVTADGTLHTANATENTDLFWAVRGGGGNFGVVTALEFTAHKVTDVSYGTITFPTENATKTLKEWRDYMRVAPEELTTMALLMPAMPGSPAMGMIMACWSGSESLAADALAPLRALGTDATFSRKPYYEVLEEAHAPAGMRAEVNNAFFRDFSDEVIQKVVDGFDQHGMIFQIRSVGGAMNRVDTMDTAFAHRDSEVLIVSPRFFPQDATDDDIEKALKPWYEIANMGNGAYSNFFSQSSNRPSERSYPAATYKKLARIKQQYDPDNLFNQNVNIK